MANPRYYELKYEGEIYTKKYEIDEILLENDLNWFFDCEVENMRIEIQKETLILNSGIFYNGVFEYGVIRDIDWRNGKLLNGVIYNGTYKRIIVEKGIIFNGIFLDGEILRGDIRGGDLRNIKVSDQSKQSEDNGQDETQVQEPNQDIQTQPQVQQTQPQVQGQIQNGDGQDIQSQVQKTQEKQENNMKSNLLKFDLFVEKQINEDLASKHYDYDKNGAEEEFIDDVQNDEDYSEEFEKMDKKEKLDSEIDEIMSSLEDYDPEAIIYDDYVISSQDENKGIIKASVWIEFVGVSNPEQYNFDELEEDFLKETSFDEVEILSSEDSITFSVNVYDYDHR